jgi:hypothetical protein
MPHFIVSILSFSNLHTFICIMYITPSIPLIKVYKYLTKVNLFKSLNNNLAKNVFLVYACYIFGFIYKNTLR